MRPRYRSLRKESIKRRGYGTIHARTIGSDGQGMGDGLFRLPPSPHAILYDRGALLTDPSATIVDDNFVTNARETAATTDPNVAYDRFRDGGHVQLNVCRVKRPVTSGPLRDFYSSRLVCVYSKTIQTGQSASGKRRVRVLFSRPVRAGTTRP